jgi:hypothetical protein
MINFLEQLVAEWYEFRGYFVRRNVKVGRLTHGGWEGELDVIAFHPELRKLVHIETSMDATSWAKREQQFAKKFAAGRKHIHGLFRGLDLPREIEQIAVLVIGAKTGRASVGGARLQMIGDFLAEVCRSQESTSRPSSHTRAVCHSADTAVRSELLARRTSLPAFVVD